MQLSWNSLRNEESAISSFLSLFVFNFPLSSRSHVHRHRSNRGILPAKSLLTQLTLCLQLSNSPIRHLSIPSPLSLYLVCLFFVWLGLFLWDVEIENTGRKRVGNWKRLGRQRSGKRNGEGDNGKPLSSRGRAPSPNSHLQLFSSSVRLLDPCLSVSRFACFLWIVICPDRFTLFPPSFLRNFFLPAQYSLLAQII